jgi:hypothetical protein
MVPRVTWVACLLLIISPSEAVLPSAVLRVDEGISFLAAGAAFGTALPSGGLHVTLVRPQGLQDGCSPSVKLPTLLETDGFALLVRRPWVLS